VFVVVVVVVMVVGVVVVFCHLFRKDIVSSYTEKRHELTNIARMIDGFIPYTTKCTNSIITHL
jgi:hypothetical protein